MEFIAKNKDDFCQKCWDVIRKRIHPGFVLGLTGDLGSGKTTLAKFIAAKLGYKGVVSSPTFVLQKKYPLVNNRLGISAINHIDLYRVSDGDGEQVNEWLAGSDDLVIVEWADRVNPKKFDVIIKIAFLSDNKKRKVVVKWK